MNTMIQTKPEISNFDGLAQAIRASLGQVTDFIQLKVLYSSHFASWFGTACHFLSHKYEQNNYQSINRLSKWISR